ncbi:hypothetical protein HMN09_01196400 [Mycena chlorophos]|uniref:Uncharacterized protein n=1 Tax=Mycena chlorophos TaxID=658473 RepID=A0A8H6VYW0_MYCCL|nr:hypothetical protein HMN09_01196400 [Mycena chlorophos]
MSSTTGSRVASTLYSTEVQPYNPYALQGVDEKPASPVQLQTRKPRRSPGLGIYRSISWILGFHEKYSLLNFFVWGGALIGFSLARAVTLDPSTWKDQLVPGEWFWFQHSSYKINLAIHITLTIVGGIFGVLQFIPAIRRRYVLLHRLNGYGTLFCLIVGNICGGYVGRRSFGGELNVQSAYVWPKSRLAPPSNRDFQYILTIMVVYAGLLGIWNDTRRHRKWMLRMVAYFGAVITARLIMLAAIAVVTDIGTYFSIWRCDEVLNLLTDPVALADDFPQCVAEGVNTASVWVAVHADVNDGPLHKAAAFRAVTGMALWIATLMHMAAVECYIILTESANQVRLGYVLEPVDFEAEDGDTSY